MKEWKRVYHDLEKFVDVSIGPALIILLVIITIEIFFHNIADKFHHDILVLDYYILGLFVTDLIFKYLRVRNIKKFIRSSWLDIIAVFPFFLIFRLVEPIFFLLSDFQKEFKNAQLIFHESLEISKSSAKIVREIEVVGKVSRARMLTGLFRAIGRSPRFLKAAAFFEQPSGKHHLQKDKDIKKIFKKK